MPSPYFDTEARLIVQRNITANVAGARVAFDPSTGDLKLVYYVFARPSDDDEEWRELAIAELIAAHPKVRTASSEFRRCEHMAQDRDGALVFERD
ncbi:hypothetical protein [Caulobacter mirabilis]|nr:hypothetical protein [Caulobacter mirabilis]